MRAARRQGKQGFLASSPPPTLTPANDEAPATKCGTQAVGGHLRPSDAERTKKPSDALCCRQAVRPAAVGQSGHNISKRCALQDPASSDAISLHSKRGRGGGEEMAGAVSGGREQCRHGRWFRLSPPQTRPLPRHLSPYDALVQSRPTCTDTAAPPRLCRSQLCRWIPVR